MLSSHVTVLACVMVLARVRVLTHVMVLTCVTALACVMVLSCVIQLLEYVIPTTAAAATAAVSPKSPMANTLSKG